MFRSQGATYPPCHPLGLGNLVSPDILYPRGFRPELPTVGFPGL
jgi:hypothetical protein